MFSRKSLNIIKSKSEMSSISDIKKYDNLKEMINVIS